MVTLIVGISRYLMILLIMIYTYYSFRYYFMKEEADQGRAVRRQTVCLFMLHFLANLLVVLNTESPALAAFYGAQAVFFLGYIYLYRLFYRKVSRVLVNHVCLFLMTGFVMLTRLNPEQAMRQFVIAVIAAAVTWIIPFVMDRVWQLAKIPWIYGLFGLFLLILVCAAGNTAYGAQLSLGWGGFSFQPSEFVKISYVFFIATMFYRSTEFKSVAVTTAGRRGPCDRPGAFQGSGKRAHLLYRLSGDAVRGYLQLAVRGDGGRRRNPCGGVGLRPFSPC